MTDDTSYDDPSSPSPTFTQTDKLQPPPAIDLNALDDLSPRDHATITELVSNPVREGLGSGFAQSRAPAIASASDFPPNSYAELTFSSTGGAPEELMQVGRVMQSQAAKRVQAGLKPTRTPPKGGEGTAAASVALQPLPLTLPPQLPRPSPPPARPSLFVGDKPIHTRRVSFAINNALPLKSTSILRETGAHSRKSSSSNAANAAATSTAAKSADPSSSDSATSGVSSPRRGVAIDNMVSLIHIIGAIKRWKNKSMFSVDRSLDSLREAATTFMGSVNPIEFGTMISQALTLSSDSQTVIRNSKTERDNIAADSRIILADQPGVPLSRQGDLAHYTTVKYLQRISNSFNVNLLLLVKKYFDTSAINGYVNKTTYIHLLLLIHRQLMPLTSGVEAVKVALEDWKKDSKKWGVPIKPPAGGSLSSPLTSPKKDANASTSATETGDEDIGFTLSGFHSVLFQLVDHWTLTCDINEYTTFLSSMYTKITQKNEDYQPRRRDGDKRPFIWKNITVEYQRALAGASSTDDKRRSATLKAPNFTRSTKSQPATSTPMPSAVLAASAATPGTDATPKATPVKMIESAEEKAAKAARVQAFLDAQTQVQSIPPLPVVVLEKDRVTKPWQTNEKPSNKKAREVKGHANTKPLPQQPLDVGGMLAAHPTLAGVLGFPSFEDEHGDFFVPEAEPEYEIPNTGNLIITPPVAPRASTAAPTTPKTPLLLQLQLEIPENDNQVVDEYVPSDDEHDLLSPPTDDSSFASPSDAAHEEALRIRRQKLAEKKAQYDLEHPSPLPSPSPTSGSNLPSVPPAAASPPLATIPDEETTGGIVQHEKPQPAKDANLTVVSLGLPDSASVPTHHKKHHKHKSSVPKSSLMADMDELLKHAAMSVEEDVPVKKKKKKHHGHHDSTSSSHGAHTKGGKKKKSTKKKHASQPSSPRSSSPNHAQRPSQELDRRLLQLEMETSSLQSPKRKFVLGRMVSIPFDPLNKLNKPSASEEEEDDDKVEYDPEHSLLPLPSVSPPKTIVKEDGTIDYDAMSPTVARLVRPRLGPQASVMRSPEEEERIIRSTIGVLDEDETLGTSKVALERAQQRLDELNKQKLAKAHELELAANLPTIQASRETSPEPVAPTSEQLAAEMKQIEEREFAVVRHHRRSSGGSGYTSRRASGEQLQPQSSQPKVTIALDGTPIDSAEKTPSSEDGALPVNPRRASAQTLFDLNLPSPVSEIKQKQLATKKTMGGGFAKEKRATLKDMTNEAGGLTPIEKSTDKTETEQKDSTATTIATGATPAPIAKKVPKSKTVVKVPVPRPKKKTAGATDAKTTASASPVRTTSEQDSANDAWLASMMALGNEPELNAAIGRVTEAAAVVEKELSEAGMTLPDKEDSEDEDDSAGGSAKNILAQVVASIAGSIQESEQLSIDTSTNAAQDEITVIPNETQSNTTESIESNKNGEATDLLSSTNDLSVAVPSAETAPAEPQPSPNTRRKIRSARLRELQARITADDGPELQESEIEELQQLLQENELEPSLETNDLTASEETSPMARVESGGIDSETLTSTKEEVKNDEAVVTTHVEIPNITASEIAAATPQTTTAPSAEGTTTDVTTTDGDATYATARATDTEVEEAVAPAPNPIPFTLPTSLPANWMEQVDEFFGGNDATHPSDVKPNVISTDPSLAQPTSTTNTATRHHPTRSVQQELEGALGASAVFGAAQLIKEELVPVAEYTAALQQSEQSKTSSGKSSHRNSIDSKSSKDHSPKDEDKKEVYVGWQPQPAPTSTLPSSSSLNPSASTVLSDAITATRNAIHTLSTPGKFLPLELSREILNALKKLAPVDSLPIAPVLRPASATGLKPNATKRNQKVGSGSEKDRHAASTAPIADVIEDPRVSMTELSSLNVSLGLLSKPAGRKTLPIGVASFGTTSDVVPRHEANTLHEIHDLNNIIRNNLDAVAQKLASSSSRPTSSIGGATARASLRTSSRRSGVSAATATTTNEILQDIHSFATTTGIARDLSSDATSKSRPSSKSPTRRSSTGGHGANSFALSGVTTPPPFLPPPLKSVTSLGLNLPHSHGPASSGLANPANALPSFSSFAVSAAMIPVPQPPAQGTVHLSSGETIQGWTDDATTTNSTSNSNSRAISPKRSSQDPTVKRSPTSRSQSAAAKHAHVPEQPTTAVKDASTASVSKRGSATTSTPAPYDVMKGVSEVFSEEKHQPSSQQQLQPPQPTEPTTSGGYTHSSTFADEFEWTMPENQPRSRVGRSRRSRLHAAAEAKEQEDAAMPLRKLTDHFSPVSYSRALRQVVDREREKHEALAAAIVTQQAQLQQAQTATLNEPLTRESSPQRTSVFAATDGSLKGWTAAEEEKQQIGQHADSRSASRTTMMMLANNNLKNIPLTVASGPIPGSAHYISPYLLQPSSAGTTPAPSSQPFPYEIQSARFAALAASFNAHPSSVLAMSTARPKTAERWDKSQALTSTATGASTARTRPVTREAMTGRRGKSQHAHFSRPHSSQMMQPQQPQQQEHTPIVRPPSAKPAPPHHTETIIHSVTTVLAPPFHQPPTPSLIAPPRLRSGATSTNVAWTAHTTPTIPRARYDLFATTATSNGGGDSNAQPIAIGSPSVAQQQRELARWSEVTARHAALYGTHWNAATSQPSQNYNPVRFQPAQPEQSRFPYQTSFHPTVPFSTQHQHALGPREVEHVYPPENVTLAPHLNLSDKPGSMSARTHRYATIPIVKNTPIQPGSATARLRTKRDRAMQVAVDTMVIQATTPFYASPSTTTASSAHPSTSRKAVHHGENSNF